MPVSVEPVQLSRCSGGGRVLRPMVDLDAVLVEHGGMVLDRAGGAHRDEGEGVGTGHVENHVVVREEEEEEEEPCDDELLAMAAMMPPVSQPKGGELDDIDALLDIECDMGKDGGGGEPAGVVDEILSTCGAGVEDGKGKNDRHAGEPMDCEVLNKTGDGDAYDFWQQGSIIPDRVMILPQRNAMDATESYLTVTSFDGERVYVPVQEDRHEENCLKRRLRRSERFAVGDQD